MLSGFVGPEPEPEMLLHMTRPLRGALVLFLLAGSAPALSATLTRQPYLQSVTSNSALVAFRTDVACPTAQVRFGQSTPARAASSASSTRHVVTLSNLTSATEYTYVVDACGASTPPKKFRTAPGPNGRTLRFAATGDMGMNNADQRAVSDAMLAARPDFWLALGDNAYTDGSESEYQTKFFQPMAALLSEVPVFATPGNHDYGTDDAQPFLDNFYLPANNNRGNERYYSFDWGPAHFVSLDSSCALGRYTDSATCNLSEQKTWLQQDLAQSTAPWKIVFLHHPPYSSGSHGSEDVIQDEFVPIFEAGGVDLVLAGHDHNYERTKALKGGAVVPEGTPGSVVYVVAGTGGANLRSMDSQPSWSAARNNQAKGYVDVSVSGGKLTATMVRHDGQVLDQVSWTKPVPPPSLTFDAQVENHRGPAPLTARFVATATEGATVTWDFGDGSSATGLTAQHTYAEPGTFTATARATLETQTATKQLTVTVERAQGQTPGENPSVEPPGVEPPGTEEPGKQPAGDKPGPKPFGCGTPGAALGVPMTLLLVLVLLGRRKAATVRVPTER